MLTVELIVAPTRSHLGTQANPDEQFQQLLINKLDLGASYQCEARL